MILEPSTSKLPWRADGPDEFGDYNILPSGDNCAVAAVFSNMRRPEEVAEIAAKLVVSVNAHGSLVDALEIIQSLTLPQHDSYETPRERLKTIAKVASVALMAVKDRSVAELSSTETIGEA